MHTKRPEDFQKFHELIRSQFVYGGKKYGLNAARESTDVLFEFHGKNWLFGTMDKYIYRFRNLERERDLLKIACYCFIVWLKKGYFIKFDGLKADVLDTNVEMKERYFPDFIKHFEQTLKVWIDSGSGALIENYNDKQKLQYISDVFKTWSKGTWESITEQSLMGVYYCTYLMWFTRYLNTEVHDEDTILTHDKK